MKRAWIIFRREAESYFRSPIAYVVASAFLLIAGFFFSMILSATQEASLRYTLSNMVITLLFLSPLVTMRLLSEERKSGTIETLMTDPVRDFEVVIGKFSAAMFFYIVLLIPTLSYVIILKKLGQPDIGPIISGYLGLVLIGGVFISLGLFCSSLSKNQIVAGSLSLVVLLFLWVIGWVGELMPGTPFSKVFAYIGFFEHFESLQKGVVDTKDVIYYLSTAVLFLFLTIRVMEIRRWK